MENVAHVTRNKYFPREWLDNGFIQFCVYEQELVQKACQYIYERKIDFTLDSFFDAVDLIKNSCVGKTVKRDNVNNRELLEPNLDKDLGAFASLPPFTNNTLPLNGGARTKQGNTLCSVSEKDNIESKRHIHNSGTASDLSTDSGYSDTNDSGVLSLPEHLSVREYELSRKTTSNLFRHSHKPSVSRDSSTDSGYSEAENDYRATEMCDSATDGINSKVLDSSRKKKSKRVRILHHKDDPNWLDHKRLCTQQQGKTPLSEPKSKPKNSDKTTKFNVEGAKYRSKQQSNICPVVSLSSNSRISIHFSSTFKVSALVDTGADSSCISRTVFDRIPSNARSEISSNSFVDARTAGGAPLSIVGESIICFELNGESFSVLVIVVDILVVDFLLGRDFLKSQRAVLDYSTNTVNLNSTQTLHMHDDTVEQVADQNASANH